jgi:hypothetical protein
MTIRRDAHTGLEWNLAIGFAMSLTRLLRLHRFCFNLQNPKSIF